MKFLFFVFLSSLSCFCQEIVVKNVDDFIGVDIHENIYYIQNNALHKKDLKNDYVNIDYGVPDIIDISNPLQILILYKLFNKVVFLDNQLSYITEFDVPFGTELISNASKDKIWIYDNISMMIKLYNLKTQRTEIKSIPIKEEILQLQGNLNKAIVINNRNELIKYNYLARQEKVINTANKKLSLSLNESYFVADNDLYHNNYKASTISESIKSFDIINNKLYFFKENNIYKLSIPKN